MRKNGRESRKNTVRYSQKLVKHVVRHKSSHTQSVFEYLNMSMIQMIFKSLLIVMIGFVSAFESDID